MTTEKRNLEEIVAEFIAQSAKSKLEMDKTIKNLSKQIGDIGNRFGTYTEGLAHSSVDIILEKEFGITDTAQNVKKKINESQWIEIDVLGVANGTTNTAVLVEVKSQITDETFGQVLKLTEQFPIFFPEHRHKHLYAIICCVSVPKKVLREKAKELGIYLATVKGEVFDLDNPKGFQAKDFSNPATSII